jgi:hypothetical protein
MFTSLLFSKADQMQYHTLLLLNNAAMFFVTVPLDGITPFSRLQSFP